MTSKINKKGYEINITYVNECDDEMFLFIGVFYKCSCFVWVTVGLEATDTVVSRFVNVYINYIQIEL